jgi:aminoglycoside 6'-N-acetyltransferase
VQLIDPLASNERAIRFYERLGFEFVEERDVGGDYCLVRELSACPDLRRPMADPL